jgi:hypothetical protein
VDREEEIKIALMQVATAIEAIMPKGVICAMVAWDSKTKEIQVIGNAQNNKGLKSLLQAGMDMTARMPGEGEGDEKWNLGKT